MPTANANERGRGKHWKMYWKKQRSKKWKAKGADNKWQNLWQMIAAAWFSVRDKMYPSLLQNGPHQQWKEEEEKQIKMWSQSMELVAWEGAQGVSQRTLALCNCWWQDSREVPTLEAPDGPTVYYYFKEEVPEMKCQLMLSLEGTKYQLTQAKERLKNWSRSPVSEWAWNCVTFQSDKVLPLCISH